MSIHVFSHAGPSRICPTLSVNITRSGKGPQRPRHFSSSAPHHARAAGYSEPNTSSDKANGHTYYDTLDVPRGASRMEIKAAYFRLSKRYHPDVRRSRRKEEEGADRAEEEGKQEEEKATERFHEVNKAYKVLIDDRQRRAYDRTLSSHPHRTRTHSHAHTPGSSSSYLHMHASTYELHRGRKRGATYAWEGGPRGYTARTGYPHAGHKYASERTGTGRHYDASSSPSAPYQSHSASSGSATTSSSGTRRGSDRLSGRALRAEEERIEHDRIVQESNVSRFFRALGIVLVVSWVGAMSRS